jgi:pyruvate/2-oxoglutarate dehydrogenase complex dihydrolipoamide dehydrogenase (E3) component
LLRSSELMRMMRRAGEFGLRAERLAVDFPGIMARKDAIVRTSVENQALAKMLEAHGIPLFRASARFVAPHELEVDGDRVITERAVIATGSVPAVPPVEGLREAGFITSDEALELRTLPSSLVIIGAGAVGLEFAEFFAPLGSRVTVLEMLPRVLPQEDDEVSAAIRQCMEADGIEIHTSARVVRVARSGEHKVVTAETREGTRTFAAREILIATGRRPLTDGLRVEAAGVAVDRGFVVKDDELRTSQEHIFAAGDVAGGYLFTHKAVYEGEIAAQNALSSVALEVDYQAIPRVTFTEPQVGGVGLSEREAREKGYRVRTATAHLRDMGKGPAIGETRGFAKLVADDRTGRLLGWHVVSHLANEIIMEGVLAIRKGLTVMDIAATVHPHPTIAEMVRAAAKTLVEGPGRLSCCA